LTHEGQERLVCTLLYSMGDKAEDMLHSTNIGEDERKVYNTVLEKVDQFYKVEKCHLQKAKFNRLCQGDFKSAEQFITNLYLFS